MQARLPVYTHAAPRGGRATIDIRPGQYNGHCKSGHFKNLTGYMLTRPSYIESTHWTVYSLSPSFPLLKRLPLSLLLCFIRMCLCVRRECVGPLIAEKRRESDCFLLFQKGFARCELMGEISSAFFLLPFSPAAKQRYEFHRMKHHPRALLFTCSLIALFGAGE